MVIANDYNSAWEGWCFMRTMGVTEFKAHALEVLDRVARSQERIVVTKRGRPLAEVGPYRDTSRQSAGKLAHAVVFENDIVSPLDEKDWEACK